MLHRVASINPFQPSKHISFQPSLRKSARLVFAWETHPKKIIDCLNMLNLLYFIVIQCLLKESRPVLTGQTIETTMGMPWKFWKPFKAEKVSEISNLILFPGKIWRRSVSGGDLNNE